MAVKLVLKNRPKDGDSANGLHALQKRMEGNTKSQFVLLRVEPVDDTVRRGDTVRLTTIEIRAIEPLVDEDHVQQAATLFEEATRRRLKRERKPGEPEPLDFDGDDPDDEPERPIPVDENGSAW